MTTDDERVIASAGTPGLWVDMAGQSGLVYVFSEGPSSRPVVIMDPAGWDERLCARQDARAISSAHNGYPLALDIVAVAEAMVDAAGDCNPELTEAVLNWRRTNP